MTITSLTIKILICSLFASLVLTASNSIATDNLSSGDVAIKGYDPVAYFLIGKAIQGDQSLSVPWRNMTWHFQNKEHMELFTTNPEKYAPQYDGFCAWAMTEKRKAVTDPEVWKIINGKLYLNCSLTAYEKWSRDIPGNIKKADANWVQLSSGN